MQLYVITSAKEIIFSSPSVCFLVCLLAGLRKNYNQFSQNSVERWHMGCRKIHYILVVIQIVIR